MSYRLILKPSAERDVERLPRSIQGRVLDRLERIAAAPRGPGSVKLAGAKATYRVRVGDWRIVYEIDDARRTILVTIVAHRREVYRGLG
jgi:mRNA interferase RelE/StbE